MAVQMARYLFNVTQYEQIGEAGILSEDARVELIDGEIIRMSPVTPHHAASVMRLNDKLSRSLDTRVIISVHNPIRLSEYSEPEPDLALLKYRSSFYADAHPEPADTLLIIEVTDGTVEAERQMKVPLYARAGIPEVW